VGWAVVGSCPVYHAASKEHVCIDHTGVIPAAAGDDLASGRITDENKQTGPLAVVVPGSPAGWLAVLERYGSLAPSDVFAPAVELIEGGFPLTKLGEVFFNGG
jgi:gamma-glutamyltranspeptidase/glutathione hydrolase